jgi:hypothetical protein
VVMVRNRAVGAPSLPRLPEKQWLLLLLVGKFGTYQYKPRPPLPATTDHTRTKHIDVRFHHVRESIALGQIDLKYVKSSEQVADVLTKPLHKPAFLHLKNALRISPFGGVLER